MFRPCLLSIHYIHYMMEDFYTGADGASNSRAKRYQVQRRCAHCQTSLSALHVFCEDDFFLV